MIVIGNLFYVERWMFSGMELVVPEFIQVSGLGDGSELRKVLTA